MAEPLIAVAFLLAFIVVAVIACAIGVGAWRLLDLCLESWQNREQPAYDGRNGNGYQPRRTGHTPPLRNPPRRP